MRGAAWLVLVLLVVPTAGAAKLEGGLWFDAAPTVQGVLDVATPVGLLNLSPALAAGRAVTLRFAAAEGTLNESDMQIVRGGSSDVQQPHDADPQPLSYEDGSLTLSGCDDPCTAYLLPDDGAVGLVGAFAGPLGLARSQGAHDAGLSVAAKSVLVHLPDTSTWLEMRGAGASPVARGRVSLLVYGGTLTLSDGKVVRTGQWTENETPSTLPASVVKLRTLALLLHLDGASIDPAPGLSTTLMAPALDVKLQGALDVARADGDVRVDGVDHSVRGQSVSLGGDLAWTLGTVGAATGPAKRPADAAAPRAEGRFSGEGFLAIGGAQVASGGVSGPALARAAGGAVLLAGLALAAFALFSRIGPGQALAHEARRRIHEHVRAHPGDHVAQISRATGIGRVVLQYHLRVLESHTLIACRVAGRQRVYFPAQGAPADASSLLALRSGASRRVMQALRDRPGATQRDLMASLGMSQRLLSYHLGRLESAGLVRVTPGKPQCYHPA